jgi:hypothetical protein
MPPVRPLLAALLALLPAALLGAGLPASAAGTGGDWFASVRTEGGLEVRADARVFTLFALLNAMGYDAAPLARREPLPAPRFHPVRQRVRERLAAAPAEVRQAADAFFDAHPVPLDRYLAFTVQAGEPPFEQGPKGPEGRELAGLEGLLRAAHTRWGLGELLAAELPEYRRAARGYLPVLDIPFQRARQLLKGPAAGAAPVVIMNLLESQGAVRGVRAGEAGRPEVALVVGPSETPDVQALVGEYARVLLEPAVSARAAAWGGGAALLREARGLGATEASPAAYATALFTRALALRATEAPEAAFDAAAQQGYFGLRDIARGFDDPRPVEAWALEALQRAETRRPAPRREGSSRGH